MNEAMRTGGVAALILAFSAGLAAVTATFYPLGSGSPRAGDAAPTGALSGGSGGNDATQGLAEVQRSIELEKLSPPGAQSDPKARRAATDTRKKSVDARKGLGLYITYCLGCHGASGLGGGCPPLVNKSIPFEAFLSQLRKPRASMPTIPETDVSLAEAKQIYEYLHSIRQNRVKPVP